MVTWSNGMSFFFLPNGMPFPPPPFFNRAMAVLWNRIRNFICLLLYVCVLHESECDMAKYFTSRLIYFHEPEASENKA